MLLFSSVFAAFEGMFSFSGVIKIVTFNFIQMHVTLAIADMNDMWLFVLQWCEITICGAPL